MLYEIRIGRYRVEIETRPKNGEDPCRVIDTSDDRHGVVMEDVSVLACLDFAERSEREAREKAEIHAEWDRLEEALRSRRETHPAAILSGLRKRLGWAD